ncbi:MAG: hypothetical protein IPI05_05285 [Flavobacteriales bacterium]|nr:hypothetical protein [Flavobacteriales bacterium]
MVLDGSACGSNTIAFGGNSAVGCNGGGAQNQTPRWIWEQPVDYIRSVRLTDGATYSLIVVDDWSDGGIHYNVRANGFLIGSSLPPERVTPSHSWRHRPLHWTSASAT